MMQKQKFDEREIFQLFFVLQKKNLNKQKKEFDFYPSKKIVEMINCV